MRVDVYEMVIVLGGILGAAFRLTVHLLVWVKRPYFVKRPPLHAPP